ncbi:MAG: GGDEF domain-containing protein, partial [Actinomycetota bacterium]|nr:GGDEF domain-containing protein [Actinomycetota bacterium]
ADRGASAADRRSASADDLTGVYRRAAGFVEVERGVARVKAAGLPLVVAFLDVDGLKRVNDLHGHAAGDRLLSEVATCFSAQLLPGDVILRYGGDEFVCMFAGVDLAGAQARLAAGSARLQAGPEGGTVTAGLAELLPEDTAVALVARADRALYVERSRRRPPAAS